MTRFPRTPSIHAPQSLSRRGLLFWIPASLVLFACSHDSSDEGAFAYTRLVRSFVVERESVRSPDQGNPIPKIASVNTNLKDTAHGGNRVSFVGQRDFTIEIRLEDIPPNSYFTTAFGIPDQEARSRKKLAAEYEIRLNNEKAAGRTIPSFREPEDRIWYEERVDLTALAGKTATILLTGSVSPRGKGIARAWAEPRLMATRLVPTAEAAPDRPNIVVVLVDTLRADHLGCYGNPRETSPRLDAFSNRALLFENAFAPSSWTWPSTATVLTGQYPLHHGVLDSARCTLMLEKETLPEICVNAGMRTAAFVANRLITPSKNFDQGFAAFESLSWKNAEVMVDAFSAWLEDAQKNRFMAYLHFMDPHGPYDPPDDYVARFSDPNDVNRLPKQEIRRMKRELESFARKISDADRRAVQNARDRYDSEILFWDHHFGRILDLLEKYGLDGKTIVVVTADHGEEFLEHGFFGHGTNLFDETLHVPLIIAGPGIRPGRVQDQVELVSLVPTLIQAARLDTDSPDFDGPSLIGGGAALKHRPVYSHTENAVSRGFKERTAAFSIRTDNWKFLINPEARATSLFDLADDGAEENDLASNPDYKKICEQLGTALEQWIMKYKDLTPDNRFGVDQETIEAFEQLGYLGD